MAKAMRCTTSCGNARNRHDDAVRTMGATCCGRRSCRLMLIPSTGRGDDAPSTNTPAIKLDESVYGTTYKTFERNLKTAPEVGSDPFQINQLYHPYQVGLHPIAGHSSIPQHTDN